MDVVTTGEGDGGVSHGDAIVAFVDAALGFDVERAAETRARLAEVIGEPGVVDVSAVAAMFQLNTRAADAIGISIEEPTRAHRSDLGERLGFDARADGHAP